MSIERAINDLIKELQEANKTGSLSGGSGSGGSGSRRRRTSTTGDGDDPYKRADERRETKEDREANKNLQNNLIAKVLGIGKDAVLGDVKRLFMSQIQDGLTLDETDLSILLDPIRRQIRRLSDFRITEGEIFKQFGTEVRNLGLQFGGSRKELEEFGNRSEELYGSARTGYRAYLELSKAFGGFYALNKNERQVIGDTTMAMEKLGFETQGMSTILDNSTRSLGQTAGASDRTLKMLASLRQQFNIGAREITDNYILAQDKLIYNSGRVNSIFADLQRTSRISGVEFSTLIDTFGEGFDTFEGAAAKAGGLNALLGGNIFNSLEFLEMDEAERLGTIVERIRGNVNVNALISDKFNLKAVANQLGLNPDQTRRLLLGETSVVQTLEKAIPSGESALNKANSGMATALNDLRNTFTQARGTIAESLKRLANSISTNFDLDNQTDNTRDITGKELENARRLELGGTGVLGLQARLDSMRGSAPLPGLTIDDQFKRQPIGVDFRPTDLGEGNNLLQLGVLRGLNEAGVLGGTIGTLILAVETLTDAMNLNAVETEANTRGLNLGFNPKLTLDLSKFDTP